MGCGQVDTIEVGYYCSHLHMWWGQGRLLSRGSSLYPNRTLVWGWLMRRGMGHRMEELWGYCWGWGRTTLSGGEWVGETCECSLTSVPPPVACPPPARNPLSLLLSVSPPSSEREALATKREVAMSVGASSSFVVPVMNSGGMLVSSRCPCTTVWIAPLLTDI